MEAGAWADPERSARALSRMSVLGTDAGRPLWDSVDSGMNASGRVRKVSHPLVRSNKGLKKAQRAFIGWRWKCARVSWTEIFKRVSVG